ncbi:MAG: type II toxin-antitoxin system prevent-host-death family antitoxin [Bryobacterales bacterium]
MIKTLRESKAKLSELVERASQGEDILITVRGKVKARLTRASSDATLSDRAVWVEELRAFQKANRRGPVKSSIEEILSDLRKDRNEP